MGKREDDERRKAEEQRRAEEIRAAAKAAEERRKAADAMADREATRIRNAVQRIREEAAKSVGANPSEENVYKQTERVNKAHADAATAMEKLNRAQRKAGGSKAASEKLTKEEAQQRRHSRMKTWAELFGRKPPGQRDKRTGNEDHGSWWA